MSRRVLLGSAGVGAGARLRGTTSSAAVAPSSPAPAGGISDGVSHSLSERFMTLAEARSVFPHAISLSDEIDWCALQGAIYAAAGRGGGMVQVCNTGRPWVLNRPLLLNPNLVSLSGGGAVLDFTRLRDCDAAIELSGEQAPAYGHERHVFEGFELIGPGRGQPIAGMKFQTHRDTLSSRSHIRDCVVHGFATGVQFGHRAYGIAFSHVSLYDCTICVHAPAGLKDAGETVTFSQCYMFNSECMILNPGAFDLKFFGCSLDYGRRLISDNNGGIDLVGCRLEISPPSEPPIHCSGGQLNMFGGFFLINGPPEGVHTPEMFALENILASVHLFGVAGWNWRTTTGRLTNGPGKVYWHQGTEINEPPSNVRHP